MTSSSLKENRVLIIMTGGTICMKDSPAGMVPTRGFLSAAMKPRPSFNDGSSPEPLPVMTTSTSRQYHNSLRTPATAYSSHILYTVYEFPDLLDSSSISSAGWTQIAESIYNNYALFDGFVILHGTDSLAYTASALSFIMSHLGKPVILTGSQASIFSLQSDAVDNLLGSLIIAGTFSIPEVCLFFHHTLYRGNRTTKTSSSSFDAFASPNHEPLGKVTGMGITINWPLVRRAKTIARFSLANLLRTSHVSCLRIFPGITVEMLDAFLRVPGLRGLILETFGAGNAPAGEDGAMTSVLQAAVQRGLVIVNVSQCSNGTVSPLYAPATILGNAGVVFGHDLTTEAALTKLFFLLSNPELTQAEITRQMGTSIRGEMTELASTQFEHPSGHAASVSGEQIAFTALGYAITKGDVASITNLLAADEHSLLTLSDYAGNTAIHLAAMSEDAEVLRLLLLKGASVHVRNGLSHTPLYLAEKMGHGEQVGLLRDSGAHRHVEEVGTGNATPVVRSCGMEDGEED